MSTNIKRIFVEKKEEYNVAAQRLFVDLKENLGIKGLENIRVVNQYDISEISDEVYEQARKTIFSEPPVDYVYDEEITIADDELVFAAEYLPGQYDQRADSASQCIQILTQKDRPLVRTAKLIILKGNISNNDFIKIKNYCINPVESREADLKKPKKLETVFEIPKDVDIIDDFIKMSKEQLESFRVDLELAMSLEDLVFCQRYFKDTEKRDPTITEIKMIDTYWSDHCRHTTFLTKIEDIDIPDGIYTNSIKNAYNEYLKSRDYVYEEYKKDISLMDIATIAMKELKKRGKLGDLDESEEINACSIVVDVDLDGEKEEWLIMFKNETHNHPTEIEPFGGAATCLGGAIRDPLSGRSYVYQAMRITGSGDPRAKVEDTLKGKLPQRKITTVAAEGYSSYGNQIGIATGQVSEFYDENFIAKRMEIGAVIAAAPKENVVRKRPVPGDIVVLVGGRTGRDGIGGATGSSKEHTEESLVRCGAEVQKGNPPTERKIQRLFRHPVISKIIKRCNDFGAGGVSVAIGELTDGLSINLDVIPKKYEGLDGTELAISESQERMAVVISKDNLKTFFDFAAAENLEATVVADVTDDKRLKMNWRNKNIVDVSREFLNTNGVKQKISVKVLPPSLDNNYFNFLPEVVENETDLKEAWLNNLRDLNNCSQKGLIEQFDSTIGAGTVLMPLGGKYQATPSEGMAAKIPVLKGDTNTATIMTYGYNPKLAKWSPYHGAMYAVVEAAVKSVVLGGDYKKIRLSLQEYFEKLGHDYSKWGKPFSALLGAFYAQKELNIPAIGGKDSMSGTFKDINVPPTLVAFAVNVSNAGKIVSQEFKKVGSKIILIPLVRQKDEIPDFEVLKKNMEKVTELIQTERVLASYTVKGGGLSEAISKMCFGNRIGIAFDNYMEKDDLFKPGHGSIILEIDSSAEVEECLKGINYKILGYTQEKETISVNDIDINLKEAINAWEDTLENIFPTKVKEKDVKLSSQKYDKKKIKKSILNIVKPNVFIPVFPGTNCEYDTSCAFERAGGKVESFIFGNLTASDLEKSLKEMVKYIKKSQIIMIPGGFSAGDEPDGSGKFIAAIFRNPNIKEAITEFLEVRDGLMLGICNGFQVLIKLGLLPYGDIREINENSPTLTFNEIGRHVSHMTQTKIVSNFSPWLSNVNIGETHMIPISHGEGRFIANQAEINKMIENGQIATQYVKESNLNGSIEAIEGITSLDGRIFGKMGHSERIGTNVAVNVPGNKDQRIFEAGINYFK